MRKKEKLVSQNIDFFNKLKDGFLEEARIFKEKNHDWDKMPDPSKIKTIYVIFPMLINPKGISETTFAKVEVIKIDNYSLTAKYSIKQNPGLFHGSNIFTNEIQIKVSEFNKIWFLSSEIATEAIIKRHENGEFFDPTLHDFVEYGMLRNLAVGNSHK